MALFELSVRNTSAVIANVYALADAAEQRVRDVVAESGARVAARTQELAPVDTGFLRDHVRLEFSPEGYVYEVGWDAGDFIGAGLAFYPYFLEYGTVHMAAQPSLTPAYEEERPRFVRELRDALRAAAESRRGR